MESVVIKLVALSEEDDTGKAAQYTATFALDANVTVTAKLVCDSELLENALKA